MQRNIFGLCLFFNLLISQVFSQNYSINTIKISWKNNGTSTNIVMTNPMKNNNWFAFGLSHDQLMVQ
jgi:hypothetical protein